MALSLPFHICSFLLLLLVPFSTNAQPYRNVSLGSSLTAQDNGQLWLSPSGDFAFGFQGVGHGYLLAVWFNKLHERTIVWSANRNQAVGRDSKVEFTKDGQLILTDQSNTEIWSAKFGAKFGGGGVSYAAMLDTGNFVVADQDSGILWETFDEPTDTILPTQTLDQRTQLISRYSETNYSNGRFKFTLQGDGNLILCNTNYPIEYRPDPATTYWSTETSDGFRLIFNHSGSVFLAARNGSILRNVFSSPLTGDFYQPLTGDFYQRVTIDHDGVLRHYAYPKNATSSAGRWPPTWTISSFQPEDICTTVGSHTNSGPCGFNSYCTLEDGQRPNCQCPPGYTWLDPNDSNKGCRQNFVPQNCKVDSASEEENSFHYEEILNMDWPYTSDYECFTSVTEDWCRQACMSDCYCAVAIYRSSYCWKKHIPLAHGRINPKIGGKSLIKVRKPNSTSSSEASCSKKKNQSTLVLLKSIFLGSSVFLNVLLLIATSIFFYRWKYQRSKSPHPHPDQVLFAMRPQRFTYTELAVATESFKEELGTGAFGPVYKGVIGFDKNTEFVAVKKLKKLVTEGEKEFEAEVNTIGGTNHKNLVKLQGFCNEKQHRLLVYEYMSNGSLASFIFGNQRPNWHKRTQIVFGIARGLCYLHEECISQIIHCDIKPQNVLLDENLTARISDFGLAKLLKSDQSRTTTQIRGTRGYVAPEWFKNMPITAKVDVYSFGILLLELICCRKHFEIDEEKKCPMILSDWACDCYKEGKVHLLVEGDEAALDDMKRVERFVTVAIWCIQEDPCFRPTMKKVMHMLEGVVHVPIPPDPDSFISSP